MESNHGRSKQTRKEVEYSLLFKVQTIRMCKGKSSAWYTCFSWLLSFFCTSSSGNGTKSSNTGAEAAIVDAAKHFSSAHKVKMGGQFLLMMGCFQDEEVSSSFNILLTNALPHWIFGCVSGLSMHKLEYLLYTRYQPSQVA